MNLETSINNAKFKTSPHNSDTFDERTREKEDENKKKKLGHKITSWKVYNILLRKLVDQLIDLGASKEIKIIAFKLWASYLQLSGAAFSSKVEEKQLPALPFTFKNLDVNSLYGIKNLRKKLFTKKRKRRDSDSLSENSTNIDNNVEPKSSNSDDPTNVSTPHPTEEEFMSKFKRKKGIIFQSSASKVMKEISALITEHSESSVHPKINSKMKSLIKRLAYDRRSKNEPEKSPSTPLTIVTLVTIIRVALQIVGDEIYLGDIQRWICEGRISFNQSHEVISTYNLNFANEMLQMKRLGFMLDIRNFTRNLNLKCLPTPNLFHLAERYCTELNLPNEFLQVVLKLMVVSKVAMDYSKYNFRVFPDYECRVMAFILFTFKLLYSLDDVTEHHLSEFADLVNQIRSNNDDLITPDTTILFSWKKWVQYVECRKAVLSMYDVSTNNLSYNDGVSNLNNFLENWNLTKSLYQTRGRRPIKRRVLSNVSQECQSLSAEHAKSDEDSIHFPVSSTPFKTYTEHLIANYRKLLPRRSRKILSQDFRLHSVNAAKNSQWYSDISDDVGIKIKIINAPRYFDRQIYETKNTPLLLIKSANPRHDIPVSVLIEEDAPEMISNNEKIISSQSTISISELDLGAECVSSIKIFDSQRYWCFHECHKNTSNDEFEQMALSNFPRSFLWLLKECASMLRASAKELYLELIFVEIMLSRLYPEKIKMKDAILVQINEW